MKIPGLSLLGNRDVSALEEKCILAGRLQVLPAAEFKKFDQELISIFCVKNAFYGLPTTELVEWLRQKIGTRSAIEIGAGNGALGRALGIPMTDSFQQDEPEIKAYYQSIRQPTIRYGKDVERFTYRQAIEKFKPEVVIGCWVTQLWRDHSDDGNGNINGIDEEWILDKVPCYIHIGHTGPHGRKRILQRPHQAFKFEWLFSRSMTAEDCIIYVWDRSGP